MGLGEMHLRRDALVKERGNAVRIQTSTGQGVLARDRHRVVPNVHAPLERAGSARQLVPRAIGAAPFCGPDQGCRNCRGARQLSRRRCPRSQDEPGEQTDLDGKADDSGSRERQHESADHGG
jgi:hypothetical protein